MDGSMGGWGMSMDIEKKGKRKERKMGKERCLEQPHARTMIV